ncbi:Vegetative incompatibility protein [Paramyrothecium foliicola]|nr:Vegetative incompatibility protein [Paramyrothecium foliicola]
MRLLNIETLQIENGFADERLTEAEAGLWNPTRAQPPPYAILSHRWVGDEVVFANFEDVDRQALRTPVARMRAGMTDREKSLYKIAGACQTAQQEGQNGAGQTDSIKHIWIDTVCINKVDMQEYSIAINSMFRWYTAASICYVHLHDVEWRGEHDAESMRQFKESEWWTRGWTLQELVAPTNLHFYDASWRHIGTKQSLADAVALASGISREHLSGSDWEKASLAQKFSWQSRRSTTLIEDRAYCMLGLLPGINMDARYGEGEKEFMRLQAIIFDSWPHNEPFDESLFAWKSDKYEYSGLFAPAPGCFKESGDVVFLPALARPRRLPEVREGKGSPGIVIDPQWNVEMNIYSIFWVPIIVHLLTGGVTFCYPLIPALLTYKGKEEHSVVLNCWKKDNDGEPRCLSIAVEKEDGTWRRVDCGTLKWSNQKELSRTFHCYREAPTIYALFYHLTPAMRTFDLLCALRASVRVSNREAIQGDATHPDDLFRLPRQPAHLGEGPTETVPMIPLEA